MLVLTDNRFRGTILWDSMKYLYFLKTSYASFILVISFKRIDHFEYTAQSGYQLLIASWKVDKKIAYLRYILTAWKHTRLLGWELIEFMTSESMVWFQWKTWAELINVVLRMHVIQQMADFKLRAAGPSTDWTFKLIQLICLDILARIHFLHFLRSETPALIHLLVSH